MEPQAKKAKITDHFRVALKPLDHNLHRNKGLRQQVTNILKPAVITINDDNINDIKKHNDKQQIKITQPSLISLQPQLAFQERRKRLQLLNTYTRPPGLKESILDHDETQLNNILAEPHYAWESYQYDREREIQLRTSGYFENPQLNQQFTARLRARFVDWLVLIQNEYRLDHEPLYMAVKLVDNYLSKKTVSKSNLELLFITSIFISVKFEYRPDYVTISELLQEFGDRYHRKQVINYEIDILSTLNFDIRFPLSYSFLRRYVRCTGADMKTLTLARYILESSLLEYNMIDELESKKAAASLLLSNKMLFHEIVWDEAAEFYTGYKEKELESLALKLNEIISRPVDRKIGAIKRKYTSEIFLSVATIAPLIIT